PAGCRLGVPPWGVVAGQSAAPTFTRSGIVAGQRRAAAPRRPPSAVLQGTHWGPRYPPRTWSWPSCHSRPAITVGQVAQTTRSPSSMRRCQSARSRSWVASYPRACRVPRRPSYALAWRGQRRSPPVRIVGQATVRPPTSSRPGHRLPAMPTSHVRMQKGPDTRCVRALQGALLHRRVTRYQIWYPIRLPTWYGVSRHPPCRVEVGVVGVDVGEQPERQAGPRLGHVVEPLVQLMERAGAALVLAIAVRLGGVHLRDRPLGGEVGEHHGGEAVVRHHLGLVTQADQQAAVARLGPQILVAVVPRRQELGDGHAADPSTPLTSSAQYRTSRPAPRRRHPPRDARCRTACTLMPSMLAACSTLTHSVRVPHRSQVSCGTRSPQRSHTSSLDASAPSSVATYWPVHVTSRH